MIFHQEEDMTILLRQEEDMMIRRHQEGEGRMIHHQGGRDMTILHREGQNTMVRQGAEGTMIAQDIHSMILRQREAIDHITDMTTEMIEREPSSTHDQTAILENYS